MTRRLLRWESRLRPRAEHRLQPIGERRARFETEKGRGGPLHSGTF